MMSRSASERLRKSEGHVWRPVPGCPCAYVEAETLGDFVNDVLETDPVYNAHPRRRHELLGFLSGYNPVHMKNVVADDNLLSFEDGVVVLREGRFVAYDTVPFPLTDRIARHHIGLPYAPPGTPTPLFDSILSTTSRRTVMIHIGRMLFMALDIVETLNLKTVHSSSSVPRNNKPSFKRFPQVVGNPDTTLKYRITETELPAVISNALDAYLDAVRTQGHDKWSPDERGDARDEEEASFVQRFLAVAEGDETSYLRRDPCVKTSLKAIGTAFREYMDRRHKGAKTLEKINKSTMELYGFKVEADVNFLQGLPPHSRWFKVLRRVRENVPIQGIRGRRPIARDLRGRAELRDDPFWTWTRLESV
jgi:hypothetical protein